MKKLSTFTLLFILLSSTIIHTLELNTIPRNTGAIAVSEDFLWVGTDNGVVRMNMDNGGLTRFGTEDGLPGKRVNSIVADSFGVLWFGTEGGLARYDGDSWRSYTALNSPIADGVGSLALDHDGSLWFPHQGGVARFDFNDLNVYLPGDSLGIDGLSDIAVCPDGTKWFHTWNTVVRFDDGEWKTFKLWGSGDDAPSIRALECDSQGTVWIGSAGIMGGEVMSYNNDSWTHHYFQDSNVTAMCIDSNDIKWFAPYHKLVKYDGLTWTYYAPEDFFYEHYRGAVADREGRIWLVCDYGVVRFDNGVWTDYPFDSITPVECENAVHPAPFLFQNHPNPFNTSTVIQFILPSPDFITLEIINASGQKIRTLGHGIYTQGMHYLVWDGCDNNGMTVSSGIYFTQLKTEGSSLNRRLLFAK